MPKTSRVNDDLPRARPSRVVVELVRPLIDNGRFPAKASLGEPVVVEADVFVDGHDHIDAGLKYRPVGGTWIEMPMSPLPNDRWEGRFIPDTLGLWEFEVSGWTSGMASWMHALAAKADDGQDIVDELAVGIPLVERLRGRAKGSDQDRLDDLLAWLRTGDLVSLRSADLSDLIWRNEERQPAAKQDGKATVRVERERARFSSWYEFFPRSSVDPDHTASNLRGALDRLDRIEAMGFDVVYLPPVHPIGVTHRKGPNNTTGDHIEGPGSPWAIGGAEGGHTSVDPQLGTVADVEALAEACRQRGMDLALDIAFQCSPDHPWVREHPQWFKHRPDGSIQYAENPPKKYQDIYPLDFESEDWAGLWRGLHDVFEFWIQRNVSVFRVDNPHTKSFAFWEWVIPKLLADHPETIFLAEAFTRPQAMQRLAKAGFSQSYTYFTWRQTSVELEEYFTELSDETLDLLRPNAWPNTPDILTEQLQHGGRAAFVSRAVLAATLSPSWGIYGPAYELAEHHAVREGSEEYLDSEKYQTRVWDLDKPESLAPLLTRLNVLRHELAPLQHLRTLKFCDVDNPQLLAYTKTDPMGDAAPVLIVVNLDPEHQQSGTVWLEWADLGLPKHALYDLEDHLGGASFQWHGGRNFVELSPWGLNAHIFTATVKGCPPVRPLIRSYAAASANPESATPTSATPKSALTNKAEKGPHV